MKTYKDLLVEAKADLAEGEAKWFTLSWDVAKTRQGQVNGKLNRIVELLSDVVDAESIGSTSGVIYDRLNEVANIRQSMRYVARS
jgi:hypothetical protein